MAFVRALIFLIGAFSLGGFAPEPDLSGHWFLVDSNVPDASERVRIRSVATELNVLLSPLSMSVEHAGTREASHPRAGTHQFLAGGTVGNGGARSEHGMFWFGDELIITATSQAARPDGGHSSSSEKWSLEADGRLIIQVVEERSGTPIERATLVYRRRSMMNDD